MAVEITDKCIKCGACEWECPTGAISPGAVHPVIDMDTCTECHGFFGESQCIVVCPVDAIAVHIEPVSALARKFFDQFPSRVPEDTSIWHRIGSTASS